MFRPRLLPYLMVLGLALPAVAVRAQTRSEDGKALISSDNPSPDVKAAAAAGVSDEDGEAAAEQAAQVQMDSVQGAKKPKKGGSSGGGRTPSTGGGRSPSFGGGAGKCGVELWSVKTMTDADAGKVQAHSIQDIKISALVSSPSKPPFAKQGSGANYKAPADKRFVSGPYSELPVYRVKAIVTTYKLESDTDYHIVAKDPDTGETLVVESVDPACAGGSSFADQFATVRQQFAEIFKTPAGPQFTTVNQPVTIIGVSFFDPPHGQMGAAPNARELHPVLCISAGSECDQYQ